MTKTSTIKTALLAGIFGAFFWSFADMLLVGFVPQIKKYSVLIESLPSTIDSHLTILMLEGSPERLMWGVYLATLSVFLYLFSVYGIYKLLPSKPMSTIAAFALFVGYATSPVGHASFGYIGLLSKSMQVINADVVGSQVSLLEQFQTLLQVHWVISVSCSAVGWVLVLIQTAIKQFQTRCFIILNPIVTAPLIIIIASAFPDSIIAVMFGCASLNIAQLLFFLVLLISLHLKLSD